jgi:TPR repeat protein
MYDKGQGVIQNDNEAVQWYRKAADQGDIFGQYLLGNAYEYGTAVLKDTGEAVRWYRKAADGGNGFAQFTLGKMYEVGRGVPQDYVMAYMWYDLAIASLTVTKSSYRANLTAHDRDELARKMTPDQIALAQKLAHEWGPK